MNGHAKRARDVVVALGFTYDHDASTYGKCVYRHPASPNEPVKLWGGMAEQASRAVIDKARRIAGLSPVGARGGESVRERARIRKQGERQREAERHAREERERAPYQEAADQRAQRMAAAREIAERDRTRHDIEALMRPGRTR